MKAEGAGDSVHRVINLRAAKHRLEKCATPLGNHILWVKALIATAIRVAMERRALGQVDGLYGGARDYLQEIDFEAYVQLAMLADGSDAGLHFLRFWDTEAYDPSRINMEVDTVRAELDELFLEEKATSHGFTRFILDTLAQPILIPGTVLGGEAKVICSTPEDITIIRRCFARMQCWVSMLMEVLQAEFPKWNISSALCIFNLGSHGERRLLGEDDDQASAFDRNIKTIAKHCSVPRDDLQSQLMDFKPLAEHIYKNTHACTYWEAWQKAKRHIDQSRSKHASYRAKHPVDAIEPALATYGIRVGCTTSGTESTFSVQTWLLHPTRDHMKMETEKDEIKLVKDLDKESQAEIDDIILGGQKVWAELYGIPREGLSKRVDNGKRSGSKGGKTRAMFIQQRRAEAGRLALNAPHRTIEETKARAREMGKREWSASMDKEVAFNTTKRRRKFLEAVDAGHILAEDVTENDKNDAAEYMAHVKSLQAVNARKREAVRAKLRPATKNRLA